MKINLKDIEAITEKLFISLKERGIETIEVSEDFYWYIPKDIVYNPYEEPNRVEMGQLSDDWNELCKVAETNDIPIPYNFVWLATVFRAIGENIP